MKFWEVYIWIYLAVSIVVTVWFTIGGLANMKEMISALKVMRRDHTDSGFVPVEKPSIPSLEITNETLTEKPDSHQKRHP